MWLKIKFNKMNGKKICTVLINIYLSFYVYGNSLYFSCVDHLLV